MNFNNKFNTITSINTLKSGFLAQKTNIKVSKIAELSLITYSMLITTFQVQNNLVFSQFF